ncbi:MAG: methyltransferase domain-containing protein [Treponema sp.]|nr:methyltransferase domain-containing protein [Treponema sp.]
MNLFFASFIPGLQNFIAETARERLVDVKIHKLLDGAVLFETETSYDKLNFFCFNNIFAVISIMEHAEKSGSPETKVMLEKYIKAAIKTSNTKEAAEIIANNSKNIRTFRIVVSAENIPASVDENLRTEAEKYISRLSGLKINRSLPDTEFWFLFRREDREQEQNFSCFMKRLTLRPSWEKTLHKGELPPPLAWTMCRLARPAHNDIVLDPFCGYGSIADAALKHFHIQKFFACDNDREAASYISERFKKRKNENFTFYRNDFSGLPLIIGEKSVDVIVTDPPWGHYREINENDFYTKMFEVFGKLLKEGGRVVVLCANNCLKGAAPSGFKAQDSIPILLSGRKAVIYRFMYSL